MSIAVLSIDNGNSSGFSAHDVTINTCLHAIELTNLEGSKIFDDIKI